MSENVFDHGLDPYDESFPLETIVMFNLAVLRETPRYLELGLN